MTRSSRILIVDDDPVMGDVLRDILVLEGYGVHWVSNGIDAQNFLRQNEVDVVLLDLMMPGMNGLEILKWVVESRPSAATIMISGHGSIQTAIEAVRLGAYDWIEKPLEKTRVLHTIRHAIEKNQLLRERRILLDDIRTRYRMVGVSAAMNRVFSLIDKIAPRQVTVLVTGESGTGKELVARAIHLRSERAAGPFESMNCAAVPDSLMESELFGHVRGAFTGALSERRGKFQRADGGTLFMDEIGDLSPSGQAKVLRVVETGEVTRVGSETAEHIDIRLITATNQDLQTKIEKGGFREDLYHRLNVIEIAIPPLRDRKEDILPLAEFFLNQFDSQGAGRRMRLTHDAESALLTHAWKGNVRELRNVIEKITVLSETDEITGGQVSQVLGGGPLSVPSETCRSYRQAKEQFEKAYLIRMLEADGWNIQRASASMGMPRSLLYRKMEKYQIQGVSSKMDK
ncbi:sigma-54-dependent Fis family transcriptional regulator [bacterium]|nr:sigma-54-dependent Fis family transcriptional regulator [bacterium]